MRGRLPLAGAISAMLALGAQPAAAACFEVIGCTDSQHFSPAALSQFSCDSLWTVRNSIYADRGYCFKTDRARSVFAGRACYVQNESQLAFNAYERANIDAVVRIERAKRC